MSLFRRFVLRIFVCGNVCVAIHFLLSKYVKQNNNFETTKKASNQMTETSDVFPTAENRSTSDNILVYNRVPKCASSTMVALVKLLSKRNKFKFVTSRVFFR